MGERKCAFEDCNALEFRTTGYCLRHRDGVANGKNPTISNIDSAKSNSIKSFFGIILIIIGLPMSIIGLIWMMDDTYVVTQMAGIIVLFIGIPIFGSGCGLLFGIKLRRIENMDDRDVIDSVIVRRLLAVAVLLTIIFILLWPTMDITPAEYIFQMPGFLIMNIIIYALMIYPLTLFYREMKKNQ